MAEVVEMNFVSKNFAIKNVIKAFKLPTIFRSNLAVPLISKSRPLARQINNGIRVNLSSIEPVRESRGKPASQITNVQHNSSYSS